MNGDGHDMYEGFSLQELSEAKTPLAFVMAARRMSAAELARRARVSSSTISRVASGAQALTESNRRKFAEALDCTERDLIEITDAPQSPIGGLIASITKLVDAGAYDLAAGAAEQLIARLRSSRGGRRLIAANPAMELYALQGRVLAHQNMELDAAHEVHAKLLAAYADTGPHLTTGFIGLIEQLGVAHLTSAFYRDIKISRLAPATGVIEEAVRLAAIGKTVFEIPLIPGYAKVVHESLTEASTTGRPKLDHLILEKGGRIYDYDRLALVFDDIIFGVSVLRPKA